VEPVAFRLSDYLHIKIILTICLLLCILKAQSMWIYVREGQAPLCHSMSVQTRERVRSRAFSSSCFQTCGLSKLVALISILIGG
jgi:hypothetical protein